MQEGIDFSVIEVSELSWPASLKLPTKQFRLLIAADTEGCTVDAISNFAEAALIRGMVYFCAWGAGCLRFHDIVDEVIVGDQLGQHRFTAPNSEDVVMTTWHDNQSLEEALEFFTTFAFPTDGYAENSGYRVVICLANSEWASAAKKFLRESDFFV